MSVYMVDKVVGKMYKTIPKLEEQRSIILTALNIWRLVPLPHYIFRPEAPGSALHMSLEAVLCAPT